jgi:hypothetical protein
MPVEVGHSAGGRDHSDAELQNHLHHYKACKKKGLAAPFNMAEREGFEPSMGF